MKLNQKLVKNILTKLGENMPVIYLNPTIIPITPPRKEYIRAVRSIVIFLKKITREAQVIPTDWIIREKSRATEGDILKPSVITGNATAPPPSLVAPAINEPNNIVIDIGQLCSNK